MRPMLFALPFTIISIVGGIPAPPAHAAPIGQQAAAPHTHGTPEQLGRLSFPTSCTPAVQATFERGVALLHSFWYEEADKTFTEVTRTEPTCAMGYWGIAMTQYRPIWGAPTAAEFAKGRTAVTQAQAHVAKTPREQDYVKAVAAYFENPAATDHRARALAYQQAMQSLHETHPADDEGTVFYALSLLGTASPADKTYAQQKKAGALLNEVLPKQPQHPGVAHYLIHSFDSAPLASLALDAARRYAQIAPSSPHALHMPSHIFVRLGYWPDAINSNLASAAAARDHVAHRGAGITAFDELHALDYLVYAWMQQGEDGKARDVVARVAAVRQVDLPNLAAGYALAAIPVRYALERRAWAEAAAVPASAESFPWATLPYAETPALYGRALGAARAGNVAAARDGVSKLLVVQTKVVAAKDPYWPTQIDIQMRAVNAWIARAEGRDAEAVELMRAAADLEDSTDKLAVTPGALLPARELLGDLLRDLGRANEALVAYEASLAAAPKRLNSLYGAGRAAEKAGNREKAKQYFGTMVSLCDGATTDRPIVAEARAFLASK